MNVEGSICMQVTADSNHLWQCVLSTEGVKCHLNYPKTSQESKSMFFLFLCLMMPCSQQVLCNIIPCSQQVLCNIDLRLRISSFFNNLIKFLSCVSFKLKMAPKPIKTESSKRTYLEPNINVG